MLDALLPAIAALKEGKDIAAAAVEGRRGADATAHMTRAKAGRSSYVPEAALHGIPDPGAVAMASVFEAIATLG